MLPLGFRLFAAQNPVATGGNFRGKQVAFWHQGDGAITLLAELVWLWDCNRFRRLWGGRKGLPRSFLNRFTRVVLSQLPDPQYSDDFELLKRSRYVLRSRADLLHICPGHNWIFSWMLADSRRTHHFRFAQVAMCMVQLLVRTSLTGQSLRHA